MTRILKLDLAALVVFAIGLSGCATSATPVAGARLGNQPVNQALADRGLTVYTEKGCYTCHAFGRQLAGPDLAGIMERRDHDWLRRWFRDTDAMLAADPVGQALLEQYRGAKMPNFRLKDADIDALFHYLAQEGARARS